MSDYVQDMKDASETFKKWFDTHDTFSETFAKMDALLQKHYDNRNAIFEELVKTLEQSDGLGDRWTSLSDRALQQLEDLQRSFEPLVSQGLKDAGLDAFYQGEKKIWTESKKAVAGSVAELISTVGKSDAELIRQLQEDLKKANEEGKVIEEAVRVSMGDVKEETHQLGLQLAEKGATTIVSEIPLIGKSIAPYATKVMDVARGGSAKIREAAKRKAAYKEILLKNKKKIDDLRPKLNDEWIIGMRDQGISWLNSLKDVGSNGDYRARDWETLAKACADKLKDRSEPAIDQAKNLYTEVRQSYIDGLATAYATMAGSPQQLVLYKSELKDQLKDIMEALRKDIEVVGQLRDNANKTTAWRELQDIQNAVETELTRVQEAIKEGEELLMMGE